MNHPIGASLNIPESLRKLKPIIKAKQGGESSSETNLNAAAKQQQEAQTLLQELHSSKELRELPLAERMKLVSEAAKN